MMLHSRRKQHAKAITSSHTQQPADSCMHTDNETDRDTDRQTETNRHPDGQTACGQTDMIDTVKQMQHAKAVSTDLPVMPRRFTCPSSSLLLSWNCAQCWSHRVALLASGLCPGCRACFKPLCWSLPEGKPVVHVVSFSSRLLDYTQQMYCLFCAWHIKEECASTIVLITAREQTCSSWLVSFIMFGYSWS